MYSREYMGMHFAIAHTIFLLYLCSGFKNPSIILTLKVQLK